MTLSEALFSFLTGGQVGSLVGTRVYPTLIDTRVGFPSIGYEITSVETQTHMRGEAGIAKASVVLTCWADDMLTAGRVAEAVRAMLGGLRGNLGGVFCNRCVVGDFADVSYIDDEAAQLTKMGKQTELTLWHAQSVPTPIGV